MNKLLYGWCVLLFVASVGCRDRNGSPAFKVATPTASEVVASYTNWTKVTPPNYRVSQQLALLCRIPPTITEGTAGAHADVPVAVFVNPRGLTTLTNGIKAAFPEGSVIVKAKYQAGLAEPSELGVMIKHGRGHDAENGDWEYAFVHLKPAVVVGSGPLRNCQECHRQRKDSDFVFAAYASRD